MERRLFLTAGFASLPLWGQKKRPRFEDYPAEPWNGTKSKVVFRTRAEREFRTQLRRGAARDPDFAGHYVLAHWGCGSQCAAGAVIDLHTGLVYPPPLPDSGFVWLLTSGPVLGLAPGEPKEIDYRLNSRLFVLRRLDGMYRNAYYFEWTENKWRLLGKFRERNRFE